MKIIQPKVKLSEKEKLLSGRNLTPKALKYLSTIKLTANDRRKK